MKNLTLIFIAIIACTGMAFAQLPELTKKEKKQGWILLFDGKTSDGWQSYKGNPFPEKGWIIDNGILSVDPAGKGGDIITTTQFSDFELTLEFKLTKGANSGIKYFILPNSNLGCEFQVLDDDNHPDAKLGKNGNRKQGSLYDLIPADPNKKIKPIGEWNQARIVSKGNHVEHWLNGKKVVSYERGSADFKELIAGSKYKDIKDFATPTQTPILLQDHGDVVSYRNIKIRKL